MADQSRGLSTTPGRSLDPLGIVDLVIGGRFRITRCIGRGGMGVVYLAGQEALDREVVVKLVRTEDGDQESGPRFQREARSLSRLSHPNIVQVFDHGRDPESGLLFIAMEYIHGITLSRYLKRHTRLSVGEFRSIADQILAGVAEAHRHQLIHRDLKPSNVMLTSNDGENLRVKLLDFGLSKVTGSDEALTMGHQILGSAMYMSPEQLQGAPVDARADVYALGVLFYQMLTGTKPYLGTEPQQVFANQARGRLIKMVDVLPHHHDLPYGLIELVESCMAVDADHRPPDACALQLALNAALAATNSSSRHAQLFSSGAMVDLSATADHSTLPEPATMASRPRPLAKRTVRTGVVVALLMSVAGLTSLVLVVVLLMVVLLNGSFLPQQLAGDRPVADSVAAEVLRSRALEAMEDGEYERSVALLTEAVALLPDAESERELLQIAIALRDRAKQANPSPAPAAKTMPSPPPVVGAPTAPPRKAIEAPPVPHGVAVVNSSPPGLRFRVGDLALGTTPARLDLPIGTWPVSVYRDDEVVFSGTLTVPPTGIGRVEATVAPKVVVGGLDAAPSARVVIESPNLYGEVLVNGRSYGYAPALATIPVGPATIELRVGNTIRKTQSILVEGDETRVVLQ